MRLEAGGHRPRWPTIHGPYGRPWPLDDVLACVGAGWRNIVLRLVRDLFLLGWDGELHQVKEKFGGLRFYIGGGSEAAFDRVFAAERESLRTCELCGEYGKPGDAGWIMTLCRRCREARA
jgi:hypothetical protein